MVTRKINKQILLASRPEGEPEPFNFELIEQPIPDPGNNEVLVRTQFMSVDPYMRYRMQESWSVGEVMFAPVVGEVIESKANRFEEGDIVTGRGHLQELQWAEYNIAHQSDLRIVKTGTAPISTALGVLGMPGRTAYFGMLDVGAPKPNDTVVVSSAAGAVGSVAGQIAALAGCRVIGTAGSDEKVNWIKNELGFHDAVNYRAVKDVGEAVQSACPGGVDVYFDNVGGSITDAVFDILNPHARVAICGQIAHYNEEGTSMGPRILPSLQYARIEDFGVSNFTHRYDEANERLLAWVTSGDISYRETVTEGLENAPKAFMDLFKGDNIGKQLVKVN